jgi:hypothetical protein
MSGMAPNYVAMADLSFPVNGIPSQVQVFGPTYGVMASTPQTYAVGGDPLPPFLTFDGQLGVIHPNGGTADKTSSTKSSLSVTNALGSGGANFAVTVQ